MKPAAIAKPPAFSIVHPFEQTPDAKNTMVKNIQKDEIRYKTPMRRHQLVEVIGTSEAALAVH